MYYPAKFSQEDNGYTVTFRDIPEAITCGDDLTDARAMAADALLTAMDFYFEDRRTVPMPSVQLQKGEEWVALPASAWAKVLLLNELVHQNISNSELARRLSTRPQDVQRIVNLHHATKIDTLAEALQQLGLRLNLNISTI
ncbi:type II toxin-antitoxin system HicB family antitoxin [Stenoxybacter acetivorans]|uniref:type II toxin-antitoxin system HicB family antitoxin n=1 Tax=Stenoxybacter acetivorans TaxID=422441 RepID=UPI0005627862|nr:type II toxin-antitoxin system HicB family antitoxin [Stenoxybacter acetivorans]